MSETPRDKTEQQANEIPAPSASPDDVKSAEVVERATESTKGDSTQTEEVGGPAGPEPTRYGDWERKGRCIDF